MASSITNVGRHLGVSCIDKLTLPLRYPNNVPVMRLPPHPVRWASGIRPPGRTGNLHAGVMMGNDRKTDLNTRNTLGLFFFFWEGWTRDNGWRGGGDGGAGAVAGADDVKDSSVMPPLILEFGSSIN